MGVMMNGKRGRGKRAREGIGKAPVSAVAMRHSSVESCSSRKMFNSPDAETEVTVMASLIRGQQQPRCWIQRLLLA